MTFGALALGVILAGCPKEFSFSPDDPNSENQGFMSSTPTPTTTLTPAPTPTPDMPNEIFITSGKTSGNIGGLSGADGTCQAAANAAGIGVSQGRSWKAILSVMGVNAKDRISEVGPWFLVDGGPAGGGPKVFDSVNGGGATLTSLPLTNIVQTQFGTLVIAGAKAWTGSLSGAMSHADNCSTWTVSTGPPPNGRIGSSSSVTAMWIDETSEGCSSQHHLYCIEQ